MQALDVAAQRGSRSVGIEEILFLMRKDKRKLVRLIRHLKFRDATPAAGHAVDDLFASEPPDVKPSLQRVQICRDFLATIDTNGDLLTVFDDEFFDEIKHERNMVRNTERNTVQTVQAQFRHSSEHSVEHSTEPQHRTSA